MSRNNTLPVHLPAALPMPFGAPGRADPLLLRPPTISAAELPTLGKPWHKALQDGVAAAVAHDHHLFAHIPDAHDPASLRRDYTDSPLVSPWLARNVERQLPSLDQPGIYRLTQTLWLLQWPDERERTVWEVVVPSLLNDLPRAAFWAGAMVASFARLEDEPRHRKRFDVDITGRCGLEIGIRQTPFGIWALRQRTPQRAGPSFGAGLDAAVPDRSGAAPRRAGQSVRHPGRSPALRGSVAARPLVGQRGRIQGWHDAALSPRHVGGGVGCRVHGGRRLGGRDGTVATLDLGDRVPSNRRAQTRR